jgi:nickel transport protein
MGLIYNFKPLVIKLDTISFFLNFEDNQMKKIYQFGLVFWILSMIMFCCPDFSAAHGTGHRLVTDRAAITVEFFYSDNEPMSYAEVLIFGPQDHQVEFQNGRTDRKGRFSVYPSVPGAWRIEASDGMGHKEEGIIDVKQEIFDEEIAKNIKAIDVDKSAMPSMFLKTMAGLSLILNLFLVIYIWKSGVRRV